MSAESLLTLSPESEDDLLKLSEMMKISQEELLRLRTIWGNYFISRLEDIQKRKLDLEVQLFSGSLNEYRRATRYWWENIENGFPEIKHRPVYFISDLQQ